MAFYTSTVIPASNDRVQNEFMAATLSSYRPSVLSGTLFRHVGRSVDKPSAISVSVYAMKSRFLHLHRQVRSLKTENARLKNAISAVCAKNVTISEELEATRIRLDESIEHRRKDSLEFSARAQEFGEFARSLANIGLTNPMHIAALAVLGGTKSAEALVESLKDSLRDSSSPWAKLIPDALSAHFLSRVILPRLRTGGREQSSVQSGTPAVPIIHKAPIRGILKTSRIARRVRFAMDEGDKMASLSSESTKSTVPHSTESGLAVHGLQTPFVEGTVAALHAETGVLSLVDDGVKQSGGAEMPSTPPRGKRASFRDSRPIPLTPKKPLGERGQDKVEVGPLLPLDFGSSLQPVVPPKQSTRAPAESAPTHSRTASPDIFTPEIRPLMPNTSERPARDLSRRRGVILKQGLNIGSTPICDQTGAITMRPKGLSQRTPAPQRKPAASPDLTRFDPEIAELVASYSDSDLGSLEMTSGESDSASACGEPQPTRPRRALKAAPRASPSGSGKSSVVPQSPATITHSTSSSNGATSSKGGSPTLPAAKPAAKPPLFGLTNRRRPAASKIECTPAKPSVAFGRGKVSPPPKPTESRQSNKGPSPGLLPVPGPLSATKKPAEAAAPPGSTRQLKASGSTANAPAREPKSWLAHNLFSRFTKPSGDVRPPTNRRSTATNTLIPTPHHTTSSHRPIPSPTRSPVSKTGALPKAITSSQQRQPPASITRIPVATTGRGVGNSASPLIPTSTDGVISASQCRGLLQSRLSVMPR